MEVKVSIYDSFTKEKFKGNQAAVVLNADKLSVDDMRNIAKEFNYSETAFLFESKKAFKKVRFFTPDSEVNLCGHATIAYVQCLFENEILKLEEGENKIKIETNLGVLPIIINMSENKIEATMMYQDDGEIEVISEQNFSQIMEALNLKTKSIGELKIVKAYTGLWDLMIHLKKISDLYRIKADMNKIKDISQKLGVISFHPFVLEETIEGNFRAYVRNFAPIVGIDEEAATGTSNGALAYYMYTENYLLEKEYLCSIQGENMERESEIISQVKEGKVLVGGAAVKTFEGTLTI